MIELEFSTREMKWSKCDSSLRYIHQAGKIDGKTTRCKSRNQRARLENCPNTEFSTSSVTKFLFFFFSKGGKTYSMRKKPLDLNILSFSLSRNFVEGGWQLMLPLFYLYRHVSRFFQTDFSFISANLRSWH